MFHNTARFEKSPPRNVLLLKGHSAGIGDLLRSSAAWRALHNRFPGTRLHVWFLTKDPGYPSEKLIAQHHLLSTFQVSDKRTEGRGVWPALLRGARRIARETQPELIIDCEPNGLRTTVLTWLLGRLTNALTVGIAQVPTRGWFYGIASPSAREYAQRHGYPAPLEYAERDFVALAALGIERNGTSIELRESPEGKDFRERLYARLGGLSGPPLLGLNIGCGTPDAVWKRPDLDVLVQLVRELRRRLPFRLVLTGAPFEKEINSQFRALCGNGDQVVDLAGETDLVQLVGVISACRLFISSDSGPYHMSVALRVPTLAVFRFQNTEHYHHHDWVECQVAPDAQSVPALAAAAERLLQIPVSLSGSGAASRVT